MTSPAPSPVRSGDDGQAVTADPAQATPRRDTRPIPPSTGWGHQLPGTSTGTPTNTSADTSKPHRPPTCKTTGQAMGTRGSGRGDNSSSLLLPFAVADSERKKEAWPRGSTAPVRGGVLQALAVFQRATPRELWPLVLPRQRCDKSVRDALGDLQWAGRVREELRLRDGRKLWCLTAAGRRDAEALLPAGTKLAALRPDRDGRAAAYSEHALDVVR